MKLTFVQVNSPSYSTISSLPPPLTFLNRVGLEKIPDYENHTVRSIRSSAPNVTEDLSSPILNRMMIVHCECVLAMFMMTQIIKPRPFEIGVSKACCWPCTVFLDELSQVENLDITIASTHSKTYGGWQFPSTFAHHQPIYQRMIDRTEERISEFLCNAEARRRSDSQYVGSGDPIDEEMDRGYLELKKTLASSSSSS